MVVVAVLAAAVEKVGSVDVAVVPQRLIWQQLNFKSQFLRFPNLYLLLQDAPEGWRGRILAKE